MQIWPFLRWHCISQTSFPGDVAKTIHNSCQISLMCWVDLTLSYGCLSRAKTLYIHIDHLLLVCFSWLLISIKIESLRSLNNVYSLSTISITIFLCTFSLESQITHHSLEIASWFKADSASSAGLGSSVVIGHKIYLCEKQISFQKLANWTLPPPCVSQAAYLSWLITCCGFCLFSGISSLSVLCNYGIFSHFHAVIHFISSALFHWKTWQNSTQP